MHFQLRLLLIGVAATLTMPLAAQPTQPASAQQPATQQPSSQIPSVGRPTKSTDPLPLFDFDRYFTGRWTFEWDVPESPLGSSGTIKGTTTYKKLADNFFEAITEATGPAGPLKITETFAYRRENKTLARMVTDSRGFSYIQIGTIGGDLGGYYSVFFESAPFAVKGQTVSLRTTLRLLSPVNYKVESRISVDGGPATNFGSPWWQKEKTEGGK
jgi:hypothetical protein